MKISPIDKKIVKSKQEENYRTKEKSPKAMGIVKISV